MHHARAASADTSDFAYSRIRDEDLQYLFAALDAAITFVQAVADNTLEQTTNLDGRTHFDRADAAEAVFEVTGVLHGLKCSSAKVCDAIHDDIDDRAEADEAEGGAASRHDGLVDSFPFDNGAVIDLGPLGWLNLIGRDEKLIDFLIPRIREAAGDYTGSSDADMRKLHEAIRGLPRARRDAILTAVTGSGEAS